MKKSHAKAVKNLYSIVYILADPTNILYTVCHDPKLITLGGPIIVIGDRLNRSSEDVRITNLNEREFVSKFAECIFNCLDTMYVQRWFQPYIAKISIEGGSLYNKIADQLYYDSVNYTFEHDKQYGVEPDIRRLIVTRKWS